MHRQKSLDQFVKSNKKSAQKQVQEEEEPQTQDKFIPTPIDGSTLPPFDDFLKGLGSWAPLMKHFTSQKKMKDIYDFCSKEYKSKTCYPPPHQIFNAFYQTPISSLKVVIVGQDPYINEKEAMGLCFSIPKGTKVPPSLANIYKNLQKTVKGFKTPNHGDLTKWANQGVFLLNGVLTVEAKKSNSHKDCGWTQFTDEVINVINEKCTGVVFLLWGKPSQLKAKKVSRQKHHILETSHPSPLSAHMGFLDSDHFVKCNEILKSIGKQEIDWSLD